MNSNETTGATLTEGALTLIQVRRFMVCACFICPALYWVGILPTGPLEWLQAIGIVPKLPVNQTPSPVEGMFQSLNTITAWLFGGASWVALCFFVMGFFKHRIERRFLGSTDAYRAAEEALHLYETTPVPLGDLVDVKVNLGGLLGRDESTIETTKGFFRVAGTVGNVIKGACVTRLDGRLFITSFDEVKKDYVLID